MLNLVVRFCQHEPTSKYFSLCQESICDVLHSLHKPSHFSPKADTDFTPSHPSSKASKTFKIPQLSPTFNNTSAGRLFGRKCLLCGRLGTIRTIFTCLHILSPIFPFPSSLFFIFLLNRKISSLIVLTHMHTDEKRP